MSDLLNERAKTHGDFAETARMSQALKSLMGTGYRYPELSDAQCEALDMIAVKIARIVSGDANEPDHWRDIMGYAQLALNACIASGDGPTRRPGECNPATPPPFRVASAS
jgi:hypothetical protein